MKITTMAIAAAATVLLGCLPAAAQAPAAYETEPVLKATDLVAAPLLKGPQHTVSDRVPVQGMLGRFAIKSEFGAFEAHGIHMLEVRVREISALAELQKTSKTKQFLEASGNAAKRPVTSAANIVMHPVDTAKGIPGGASRMWERAKLGGAAVAEAATGSGKTDKTDAEKMSDVTNRVGSISVDVMGFEKERRDIAKKVGVDPYTTNPVLAKKLTDMAWVAFSGRFTVQIATSVVVPFSAALSAVTITNTAVYDTPPGDLINNAIAVFKETGADEAQVGALVKNPQYSLSVLTATAAGVQRLKGVRGLPSLVSFAAAAKTEDEARFVAASVNMLARYHESVERLAEVSAPGPILGRTAAGTLMVPAPVDYIAWTERMGRTAQREDLKAAKKIAWLSGRMSPRAKKEFAQRGWAVEESFTIAAER